MTEKTFVELQNAILAEIKNAHPTYDAGLQHAVFLGKLLAHTDKATLLKILNGYTDECARCGEMVLPTEHPEIGCDQ